LKYKGDGMKEMHPAVKGLDVTILHELILKGLLGFPRSSMRWIRPWRREWSVREI